MGLIRPATPGFLTTLAATIILAVVSFSVPWFKSIYFMKASLAVEGIDGSITFGTLGYCLELGNGTTCSKASVGYELNVNQLVGNKLPVQIPNVAVKWLTYALVLHLVAFILAAISALFGLLAHVREMSMTCFSSCISGFGATIALLAFIFDLAFFFIAKSRINKVKGGSASMGNAIWLTLAAWILLFFSGCFYGLGRCCVRRRPRSPWGDKEMNNATDNGADQIRLDAVKAEADRKARQQQGEVGLPAFHEYEETPLKASVDGDAVYADVPYRDNAAGAGAGLGGRSPSQGAAAYAGGYVRAPAGTRAVDEYNDAPPAGAYPPQPRRQGSGHTQASSHAASNYAYGAAPVPPMPNVDSRNQYPSPTGGYNHNQYASGQEYGHTADGTTYHAATPSQYNDPYNSYPQPQPQIFNAETYNTTAALVPPAHSQSPPVPTRSPSSYYTPVQHLPERNYTLGGDGYGSNVLPEPTTSGFMPFPGETHPSPGPINTNVAGSSALRSPENMGGPRAMMYDDNPPMYDGPTHRQSNAGWGKR